MEYSIEYFHKRVRDEIESWPKDILADYGRIIELLTEFGPDLGFPCSRAMEGGLFELRPKSKSGIGRVFYCFRIGHRVVILHAFIKKSQKTHKHDLDLARKRMKEIHHV